MMKWRVLTLFCINMYRITQERDSIFLSMIVKSSRFSHFYCRTEWTWFRNFLESKSVYEHYFDWRFNGASWVNTETRLFDKIGTSFFLDFHSIRHFRPTFYVGVQIICNNFLFFRFCDVNKCLICLWVKVFTYNIWLNI